MKTTSTFTFPKSLKTMLAYTTGSVTEKNSWKAALIQSQAFIQDKNFSRFVMNYDVKTDGSRAKPKKDNRKPN